MCTRATITSQIENQQQKRREAKVSPDGFFGEILRVRLRAYIFFSGLPFSILSIATCVFRNRRPSG